MKRARLESVEDGISLLAQNLLHTRAQSSTSKSQKFFHQKNPLPRSVDAFAICHSFTTDIPGSGWQSSHMLIHPREYKTPDLLGNLRSLESFLDRHKDDPKWFDWCQKARGEIERLTREYERRQVH